MAKAVTINNKKHLWVKVEWLDICGNSALQSDYEFNKLKAARIVTEAYLYDLFEEEGNEFVRTFASYQNVDDIGYGDTNVYPLSVFTKSSQKRIRKAWKEMSRGSVPQDPRSQKIGGLCSIKDYLITSLILYWFFQENVFYSFSILSHP